MRLTLDGYTPRIEDHRFDKENVTVVCDNYRHDGSTSFYSQMECAFLERQEYRIFGVASSSLGKHVYTLALGLDLHCGAFHSLPRILAVLTIDEDGSAQRHIPSQNRQLL